MTLLLHMPYGLTTFLLLGGDDREEYSAVLNRTRPTGRRSHRLQAGRIIHGVNKTKVGYSTVTITRNDGVVSKG